MFTQADEVLVWDHIAGARTGLYDYLRALQPAEWDHPSLCEGWRVRDVVAHLIIIYQYSLRGSAADLAHSGFRINSFLRQTAIKYGSRDPGVLLQQFRALAIPQSLPFFVPALNVLADTLIHEQDIRIPLGDPSSMSLDALRLLFSHWQPGHSNIGEKITGIPARTTGIAFHAVDINVKYGSGLMVTGSAQDILMAMTGRPGALKNLRGPGVAVLSSRFR
jgi:uncharacterized protein (TIGR03083 family)